MLLLLLAACSLQAQSLDEKLIEAISAGDTAAVTAQLKAGASPNARMRTYPALVVAFFANKPATPAIIAALLKAGADASAMGSDNKPAPQLAAEQPKLELLNAFLDNGVSPDWKNQNRESMLALAASYGQANSVKLLLHKKANINAQDDEGFTPLMNACQNRHVEVVKILLEAGADISLKSKYGDTALSLVKGKFDDTKSGKARKEIETLLTAPR